MNHRVMRVFVATLISCPSFDVRVETIGQVHGVDVNLLGMPSRVCFEDGTEVEVKKGEYLVVRSCCEVAHYVGGGAGWFKEHYVPLTHFKIFLKNVDCVLTQSTGSPSCRRRRKESGKKESGGSIVLIQPRYPHGGKKQTYLPTGVLNLGSRLVQVGMKVDFIDLNRAGLCDYIEVLNYSSVIGVTVLGPSYIPEVIRTIREMRQMGLSQLILVGGQGVSLLKDESNFAAWFDGLGAVLVKNPADVASYCGIAQKVLPSEYQVSLVPMLEKLSNEELRAYLTTEFALFLSQGCKFNCAFCAAKKATREEYRTCESFEHEVRWICDYLKTIGHFEFRVYLSNLDGFQSSMELEKRLDIVKRVCEEYGITPRLRCLATSRCTFTACENDPELPHRLRECGLEVVGFGADGADEETWARQNKTHNSLSELQIVADSMERAGIAVELLMVIGFQDDSVRTLWRDFKFSLLEAWKGRIIRPYLAKSQTPAGRWPKDDPLVMAMVADSNLLSRLDYAMVGSVQTHPNFLHRMMVNGVYLALIGLLAPFGKCPTRPLFPVPNGFGRSIVYLINRLMPFDR